MKTRKITTFVLIISLILLLSGCTILKVVDRVPPEGVWYCEELQMQLSCESDVESYVMLNGEKVRIMWGRLRDHSDTGMIYWDIGEGYERYDTHMEVWNIDLTESTYVVEDKKTGIEYTFIRIE